MYFDSKESPTAASLSPLARSTIAYSYAHDAGDGHQYEGRVVSPNDVMVSRDGPSRIAYNVYQGGHWRLHVSQPGATGDALVLDDVFLWDIRDLDQDGVAEWVMSPSRDPDEPNVPGYYFVKWRAVLAHWDEAARAVVPLSTIEGAIPICNRPCAAPATAARAASSSRRSRWPRATTSSRCSCGARRAPRSSSRCSAQGKVPSASHRSPS
jgi:hypothetical protein